MSEIRYPATESWDWSPGEAVGPFRLLSDADSIIQEMGLRQGKVTTFEDGIVWIDYCLPGRDSVVVVCEGKIENIQCCDSLRYEGQEILDREWDFVRMLLGPEDWMDEILPNYVRAMYGELGLTLWYEYDRVKSATCHLTDEQYDLLD